MGEKIQKEMLKTEIKIFLVNSKNVNWNIQQNALFPIKLAKTKEINKVASIIFQIW